MIYGIGTDIIQIERVKKSIETIPGFSEKIFTSHEIEYCNSKKNKYEHFAARFAAKEAFFKAIGTGWRGGLAFSEIEVNNDELGKPSFKLYGKSKEFSESNNFTNVHLSITHIKELAQAFVIIEI
ncbi:MAG: holo-ACP synthase [Candidatus Delongbacteria bacterium]|jgi:holo-[acyl-carrier protein] synthase|nr:holo-ACP synthase [Candidatus Delongbacteria bacterium]